MRYRQILWMGSGGQAASLDFSVLLSTLVSVFELDAGLHKGDEFGTAHFPPSVLGGVEELVGHHETAAATPAPFVTLVRALTVANVDSIGLVVRRWTQWAAG